MNQSEFDERFGKILFVTTPPACERMGAPDQFQQLSNLAGDFLVELDIPSPGDVDEALRQLSIKLLQIGDVRGVVLLGNHDELPSQSIQCVDDGVITALGGPGTDVDGWTVLTDAVYGNLMFPSVPVSRLPMVPSEGGLLPAPVPDTWSAATSLAIHSFEFRFVEDLFPMLPGNGGFGLHASPPLQSCTFGNVAGCLGPGGLQADIHYLMLHGEPMRNGGYRGVGPGAGGSQDVLAIAIDDVEGRVYSKGVIFSGACRGGNIERFREFQRGTGIQIAEFQASDYLALRFVNLGANAYLGFTSYHAVPSIWQEGYERRSEPLHRYFWHYLIDQGERPARALFLARQQILQDLATDVVGLNEYATLRKSYWSAICLGIGW